MKRIIILLLAALLCLPALAMAEPRYPEAQGPVTDAAAVLSPATVQDLRKLADLLEDEHTMNLSVVTVDFLDGATIADYAAGLRDKWSLGKDDLLLLMAVGEDRFGFFGGRDVNKKLSASVQQKLLSTGFEAPFLRQDYDGAIASLMPALATEAAKAWNEDIDITGLFGTVRTSPLNTEQDWLVRPVERTEKHIRYDDDDEFSLGKVILSVILIMILFGHHRKYGRHGDRRGCGCGCFPFSSLLAGWGLWKLWKK